MSLQERIWYFTIGNQKFDFAYDGRGKGTMHFEDFMKYCIMHKIPLDWMGYNIFYLHYLVTRGNEESIYDWLDAFSVDKQATMLNDMTVFDYTALHRVCYWISGPKALRICRTFVERGCLIQKDKLGQMPWEMDGNVYVNILNGKTICPRDVTAFTETYEMLKEWSNGLGCNSFLVNKVLKTNCSIKKYPYCVIIKL